MKSFVVVLAVVLALCLHTSTASNPWLEAESQMRDGKVSVVENPSDLVNEGAYESETETDHDQVALGTKSTSLHKQQKMGSLTLKVLAALRKHLRKAKTAYKTDFAYQACAEKSYDFSRLRRSIKLGDGGYGYHSRTVFLGTKSTKDDDDDDEDDTSNSEKSSIIKGLGNRVTRYKKMKVVLRYLQEAKKWNRYCLLKARRRAAERKRTNQIRKPIVDPLRDPKTLRKLVMRGATPVLRRFVKWFRNQQKREALRKEKAAKKVLGPPSQAGHYARTGTGAPYWLTESAPNAPDALQLSKFVREHRDAPTRA
eukprot:TRINITY_DN9466_c0_g1_i1.p1 TRINITY_DN9466_c0_g1~~TRINITY_DN9466_c0_g1_i1.p1  ORF type:complete len:311 (+),score=83.49 TRINITY_DN9466_c0_g1_i1:225-1157(+)